MNPTDQLQFAVLLGQHPYLRLTRDLELLDVLIGDDVEDVREGTVPKGLAEVPSRTHHLATAAAIIVRGLCVAAFLSRHVIGHATRHAVERIITRAGS